MAVFLNFDQIDAPVQLDVGADMVDFVRRVLPKWPFALLDHSDTAPFFSIKEAEPGRYLCQNLIKNAEPRRLDALNAICDMVAAMSYALVSSQPAYICLHAAAVEISGRLVVIPNTRKAGKSTLTAVLAQRGHPVFTDDALPVCFDELGRVAGRAGGIYPRLRLPLPVSLDPDFRDWVAGNPGPDNGQYKYLEIPDLPPSGQHAPLGAIVFLERQDGQPPSMNQLDPEGAMDALLYQNFTREVHSADVLKLVARMVNKLPCTRLTYAEAHDAAAMLENHFRSWPNAIPSDVSLAGSLARADLEKGPVVAIRASGRYRQKPGAAMAAVGGALYLSDQRGGGIHRMNPVSQAIWTLLEHPISPDQIRDTLSEVFPDTDPDRIGSDVTDFLTRLSAVGLISAAST